MVAKAFEEQDPATFLVVGLMGSFYRAGTGLMSSQIVGMSETNCRSPHSKTRRQVGPLAHPASR